jgi:hypothetical protein
MSCPQSARSARASDPAVLLGVHGLGYALAFAVLGTG